RATLSEARECAVATVATDTQHGELVDKINQLTILRKNNATLRADAESQGKRARALDSKLTTLCGSTPQTVSSCASRAGSGRIARGCGWCAGRARCRHPRASTTPARGQTGAWTSYKEIGVLKDRAAK
ncbi:hypothetical protein HETIRDRAFT_437423, partial [Heterobasidion irregulare TC 32-1]